MPGLIDEVRRQQQRAFLRQVKLAQRKVVDIPFCTSAFQENGGGEMKTYTIRRLDFRKKKDGHFEAITPIGHYEVHKRVWHSILGADDMYRSYGDCTSCENGMWQAQADWERLLQSLLTEVPNDAGAHADQGGRRCKLTLPKCAAR